MAQRMRSIISSVILSASADIELRVMNSMLAILGKQLAQCRHLDMEKLWWYLCHNLLYSFTFRNGT